ncbi:MAG: sulfatase [Candidatus Bathyarchaeota archaeon]|nr:sulfatase [Candidatus Bathyarchaeota archaeon]
MSEKSGGKSIRELEAIPKMGRYFFPWGGFRLDTLNPPCNMNVIVVISDTLRRDHVGCYGGLAQTPALDRFARDAAVFENAFISSFPTLPNRTDHFTGKYSFLWRGWSPLPTNEVVLAETLGHYGVLSMLIGDTYHLFRDNYFYSRGFSGWYWNRGQEGDRLTTDRDIPIHYPCNKEKIRWWKRGRYENIIRNRYHRRVETDWFAPGTVTKAMDWLDHNYKHKSFLLWIDLFDPHEPWDPPNHFIELYDSGNDLDQDCDYPVTGSVDLYSSRELARIRARYKAEITMVDKWFGRLLEKIDELQLQDNTMIIFTTDHGHYFGYPGDDDLIGKPIGPKGLLLPIIHIPLLVRMPDDTGRGERVKGIVQPVDTFSTILDFLNLPPVQGCHGQSFLPLLRDDCIESREYGLSGCVNRVAHFTNQHWGYTCFQKGPSWKPAMLFNLEEDPTQQYDIIDQEPELADALYQKFIEYLLKIQAPSDQIEKYAPY